MVVDDPAPKAAPITSPFSPGLPNLSLHANKPPQAFGSLGLSPLTVSTEVDSLPSPSSEGSSCSDSDSSTRRSSGSAPRYPAPAVAPSVASVFEDGPPAPFYPPGVPALPQGPPPPPPAAPAVSEVQEKSPSTKPSCLCKDAAVFDPVAASKALGISLPPGVLEAKEHNAGIPTRPPGVNAPPARQIDFPLTTVPMMPSTPQYDLLMSDTVNCLWHHASADSNENTFASETVWPSAATDWHNNRGNSELLSGPDSCSRRLPALPPESCYGRLRVSSAILEGLGSCAQEAEAAVRNLGDRPVKVILPWCSAGHLNFDQTKPAKVAVPVKDMEGDLDVAA